MNLFDAMHDEQREKLLAAGWVRADHRSTDGMDVEQWRDADGNLFSLGGAVAEQDRRERDAAGAANPFRDAPADGKGEGP